MKFFWENVMIYRYSLFFGRKNHMFGLKQTLIAAAIFVLFIAEASAISASKCQNKDWYKEGVKFGEKGEPEDKVIKNQEACQKKGVEIPITEYKRGWQEGISKYCNADNAYKLGFKKKKAGKNCPLELKTNFDRFYAWGKEASQVEKDIKKSQKKLKRKKRDLSKTQKKAKKLESEVEKLEKQTEALKNKVAHIEKEMSEKRKAPQPKPISVNKEKKD